MPTIENVIEWLEEAIAAHDAVVLSDEPHEIQRSSANKAAAYTLLLLKIRENQLNKLLEELPTKARQEPTDEEINAAIYEMRKQPLQPIRSQELQIFPSRRAGNTTRQADVIIQQLFTFPGQWIAIADHSGAIGANEYLTRMVIDRMYREHRITGASPARSNTQPVPYLQIKPTNNSAISYLRLITENDLPKSPDKLRMRTFPPTERQPVGDIHPDFVAPFTTPKGAEEPEQEGDFTTVQAAASSLLKKFLKRFPDYQETPHINFYNPLSLNVLMTEAADAQRLRNIPTVQDQVIKDAQPSSPENTAAKIENFKQAINSFKLPRGIQNAIFEHLTLTPNGELVVLIPTDHKLVEYVIEQICRVNKLPKSLPPVIAIAGQDKYLAAINLPI